MSDKKFGLYIMIISVFIGAINLFVVKTDTLLVYTPYLLSLIGGYYHIKHIFVR